MEAAITDQEELSFVFQPMTLGRLTVKNRILDPPKTLLYGVDNIVSDRHIAFYRERAKGGMALQIAEQTAAHPIAKGSFYQGITAYEKRAIPQYEKLADAVHEFGSYFFVQLFHPGVHDKGTTVMDEWHPLWAASRVPSNVHHEVPMVMEQEHIDDLVRGFGLSAQNLQVAGIDGVEVHAAHSYGVAQFMSPYYNKRTDEYGVRTRGGTRLPIEIGTEIRHRVGDEFVVGIRMCWDEFLGEAGIIPDLAAEQLEIFAASGLFDYYSISGSAYPTLFKGTASMRMPQGYMIPFGKAAKEIVGRRGAVFIVGRIKTLEMANDIIRDAAADMVCMSRASLADPFLIKKTQEGRADEVIRCIGYNECIARLFEEREVVCALNPTSGREQKWGDGSLVPVAPADAKRIVVVGGGLAGMKTASVAAKRGHSVVLLEREDELGGHINLLRQLPTRGEWAEAIDNLRRAMAVAGVEVRAGVEATKAVLEEEDPDAVVWATGAEWDPTGFSPADPSRERMPGAEQENVIHVGTAVERAVEDPKSLGIKVIISEETGDYFPLGLAELLGENKVAVEVISPHLFVGEGVMRHLEMGFVYPALRKLGVKLTAQHAVDSIEGDIVTVREIWTGDTYTISDVDTVVLSHMRVPNEGIYRELTEHFPKMVRVGDVVAPRRVAEVMFEAEKVGRNI